MENTNKKRPLNTIASDYFGYLGKHLPQQCASDEFYFLPRSDVAIQHLNVLDDLSPGKIQDHIRYVHDLLHEISPEEREDLEEETDRLLLKKSMDAFINEFEDAKGWRTDPTLYVKIPLFATDHILSQEDGPSGWFQESFSTLFDQIPLFLCSAIENLRFPSVIAIEIAQDMVRDAMQFYGNAVPSFIVDKVGENQALLTKNKRVLESWERYGKDLLHVPNRDSFAKGEDGFRKILAVGLNYSKSPDEILEIARASYQRTQGDLRTSALEIDGRKSWERLIYEQGPSVTSPLELMRLFERRVQDLRRFFYAQDIMTFPSGEKVTVQQTPSYLLSLRATASYKAPLTGTKRGQGIFYITPGKEDLKLIACHSVYVAAHETYPGHHILDHVRIHHPNPIRRQIESPLFYEGWACYAEHLLDELGYVQDPRQRLIGLKRQLWRNLRAVLDVELQTGQITLADGAKRIESIGFSAKRAQRQLRRFALTPGYQVCYALGMHEILRLRKRFSSKLGLKAFNDTLLSGGQVPFHLADRRIGPAALSEKSL